MPNIEGKDRLNKKFFILAGVFIVCAVIIIAMLLLGAFAFLIGFFS